MSLLWRQAASPVGHKSDRAREVVAALWARGVAARPLGDVVYLLASPTASPATCAAAARSLLNAVDRAPLGPGPAAASAV